MGRVNTVGFGQKGRACPYSIFLKNSQLNSCLLWLCILIIETCQYIVLHQASFEV